MVKSYKRKYWGRRKSSFTPKSLKSVKKIRGGFVVPSPGRVHPGYVFKPTKGRPLVTQWKDFKKSAERKTKEEVKRFQKGFSLSLGFKIGKTALRLATSPDAGVSNPSNTRTVIETLSARQPISGTNKLFTAHKHSWKVDFGYKPSGWLKDVIKDNGFSTSEVHDTTIDVPMGATREELTKDFGFNRKLQWLIPVDWFGFDTDLLNSLTYESSYDTSRTATQTAYAGISNLRSYSQITNMNRYVPMYLKVSLVGFKNGSTPRDTFLDACANTFTGDPAVWTQVEGAMPVVNQMSQRVNGTSGPYVYVDPHSSGVKGANNWKENARIVASKTFKLSAGDHLEIEYDHRSGSGIRLDKLFGYRNSSVYNAATPVTFMLLIEAHGEMVELVNTAGTQVMKGTCIGSIQTEFKTFIQGAGSQRDVQTAINTSGTRKGYLYKHYPVKVYSNSLNDTTDISVKRFNLAYNELGTSYSIPIMSDADSMDAGKNV